MHSISLFYCANLKYICICIKIYINDINGTVVLLFLFSGHPKTLDLTDGAIFLQNIRLLRGLYQYLLSIASYLTCIKGYTEQDIFFCIQRRLHTMDNECK